MRQGWDPRYKIWVEHGEPAPPTPPPVIDNTRQPLMSDMTALLNDLSYIPPNNEHNEPTQGDIGETSNEPTQATRNEFEELYASANEELYPGCDYVTRLDFMAKFTYFKAKDLDFCPVCNTSRWKDSNTPGKKVPKKVLRYFPIIHRLQCLYKSSHTANDMICPKSSSKDIDVYLRPLIDDLKVLWALKGVETIDVATGQKFNMRAMVLWTINDFPTRSSLFG
ncbi:hypothetical protein Tco_0933830 [Tanacetum coccineum]